MASSETPAISNATEPPETRQEEGASLAQNTTDVPTTEPESVELTDLNPSKAAPDTTATTTKTTTNPSTQPVDQPASTSTTTQDNPSDTNAISSIPQGDGAPIARKSEEESAIGPATERPLANVETNDATGLQLVLTLLLHSTDTRHPYIITEKYLRKRNITVAGNDPVNLTVYNLKDLIWRDWRDDWETRPASPTSIRLIHMGRMLDDKAYLKDSRFATGQSPHVVHMSIKPQEAIDDEDARIAKGSTRDRDDSQRSSRCRCVIL